MALRKKIGYCFMVAALAAGTFMAEKRHDGGFDLTARNWYLNPDGDWVVVVQANNERVHIKYKSSAGTLYPLPVWVFNNANAVKVITQKPTSLTVTAVADDGRLAKTIVIPPPAAQNPSPLQLTVKAVGPYLVTLGFSWLGSTPVQEYQIWRRENNHHEKLIGYSYGNTRTFPDVAVKPSTVYHYRMVAINNNKPIKEVTLGVKTPPEMAAKTLEALKGKGIIIYIDPTDIASAFYYKKLTPEKIIEDCKILGFGYIQLRTVYGYYSHFNNPDIQQWLSNLLELAGKNKIYVLSWCIPRHESTNAVSEDIVVAAMRSPSGYTFAGVAVDLETGKEYMGNLPQAKNEIANYMKIMRVAVGTNYLVSAIVFTPWKTGYTNQNYPYQELGQTADVLQPMVFWHHFYESAHHIYSAQEVQAAISNSIAMTKQLAGRDMPVNVIGQSIDLGNTGLPTSQEINFALQAALNAQALGVSFFAWNKNLVPDGQASDLANAIQNFRW